MVLPNSVDYKDIHVDVKFPRLTMDRVTTYLHTYDRTVDKSSMDLYNDGFVNFIRLAVTESCFFFKAECRASIKLHVTCCRYLYGC